MSLFFFSYIYFYTNCSLYFLSICVFVHFVGSLRDIIFSNFRNHIQGVKYVFHSFYVFYDLSFLCFVPDTILKDSSSLKTVNASPNNCCPNSVDQSFVARKIIVCKSIGVLSNIIKIKILSRPAKLK